jgi:hypothetical protein
VRMQQLPGGPVPVNHWRSAVDELHWLRCGYVCGCDGYVELHKLRGGRISHDHGGICLHGMHGLRCRHVHVCHGEPRVHELSCGAVSGDHRVGVVNAVRQLRGWVLLHCWGWHMHQLLRRLLPKQYGHITLPSMRCRHFPVEHWSDELHRLRSGLLCCFVKHARMFRMRCRFVPNWHRSDGLHSLPGWAVPRVSRLCGFGLLDLRDRHLFGYRRRELYELQRRSVRSQHWYVFLRKLPCWHVLCHRGKRVHELWGGDLRIGHWIRELQCMYFGNLPNHRRSGCFFHVHPLRRWNVFGCGCDNVHELCRRNVWGQHGLVYLRQLFCRVLFGRR